MKSFYLTSFLVAVLGVCTLQGQTLTERILADIEANKQDIYCQNPSSQLCFGGFNTAVIEPNGNVTSVAFGLGTPVEQMETSNIQGTSEFTHLLMATLALAMEADGQLSLNDQISNYVTFNGINGSATIQQLLSHQAGFADYTQDDFWIDEIYFEADKIWSTPDLLSTFAGPAIAQGSFNFSNTHYLILGEVLAAAGTGTLADKIDQYLMQPAGISGLSLYGEEDPEGLANLFADAFLTGTPQAVTPHTSIMTASSFAGGILSTPDMLVKFMKALAEGRVLDAAQLTKMTSFTDISGAGRPSNAYGLGVERFNVNVAGTDKEVIGYFGNLNFPTIVLYSLEDSVGVAVQINNNVYSSPETIFALAADMLSSTKSFVLTSLDEEVVSNANWTMTPNPTDGNTLINFELKQSADVQVRVYNNLGSLIHSTTNKTLPNGQNQLNLSVQDWPNGLYQVQLVVDGSYDSQSLMVE